VAVHSPHGPRARGPARPGAGGGLRHPPRGCPRPATGSAAATAAPRRFSLLRQGAACPAPSDGRTVSSLSVTVCRDRATPAVRPPLSGIRGRRRPPRRRGRVPHIPRTAPTGPPSPLLSAGIPFPQPENTLNNGGGPGRCLRNGTRDLPPWLRPTWPLTHRYLLPPCSDLPAYPVGILVLHTCRCGPDALLSVQSDSDRERGALLCCSAVPNRSFCRTRLPTARPSHPTPQIP